jgi:hypothetical protein
MSRVRLYLDEDSMRNSLVFGLRVRNVDVLTAYEAGMINREDQDHLEAALASGRVLYSFNAADYCVLHQTWISQDRPHAGIIVAQQQRYSIGEELRRLLRLIGTVSVWLVLTPLLEQQLAHVRRLAVNRYRHNKLAAPFERARQRHIHLIETRVNALRTGIQHGGVNVSDRDADIGLRSSADSGPVQDQVVLRCHVDGYQSAVACRTALRGVGVGLAVSRLRRNRSLSGLIGGVQAWRGG